MISNWGKYYSEQRYQVPPFIVQTLQKNYNLALKNNCDTNKRLVIVELGGANSKFFEGFKKQFNVSEYHILDNNRQGLNLSSINKDPCVHIHDVDLLNYNLASLNISADFVFSAGLVEHFNKVNSKKIIEGHFILARTGGIVLMSFPTPTKIYWAFRYLLEKFNRFPPLYERPLKMQEIEIATKSLGSTLKEYKLWSTILTQQLAIFKK